MDIRDPGETSREQKEQGQGSNPEWLGQGARQRGRLLQLSSLTQLCFPLESLSSKTKMEASGERPRETESQEDGDFTDMLSPASGKQVQDDPDAGSP